MQPHVQHAGDIVGLLAAAAAIQPKVLRLCKDVCKGLGAVSRAVPGSAKTKGVLRIIEKTAFEVEPHKAKDLRFLCDVARNSITVPTMAGMSDVLHVLLQLHEEACLHLLRIKDRFTNPTAGGWADLCVNAVLLSDPLLHVFELQIVHEKMSLVRCQMGGHSDYVIARASAEIVDMLDERQCVVTDEPTPLVDASFSRISL